MTFVIQRVTTRGVALTQVSDETLRIGRGTNCELRSDNPAVALDHAIIESDAGGYSIVDHGSITGTYINGRPVEAARLAKQDTIEIGDLRITVQLADAGKPLFLRVEPAAGAAAEPAGAEPQEQADAEVAVGGALRAPTYDYAAAYRLYRPYITKSALSALLAIAVLFSLAEVMKPENQTLFMPGGVSSAHARARDANDMPIATNCGACHEPWRSVSDTKCMACHGRAPHAQRQAETPTCMSCHTEHRAMPKLALVTDDKCAGCHRDLRQHISGDAAPSVAASITSFGGDHPDFRRREDRDVLRFNHKLHLQAGGIFNAQGQREMLACTSCHALVENHGKADPAPIRFDTACQRCHRLTFDARFPNAEVPHGGDPGLVYGFVVTTYAGNRDIAGKSPEEIRRILTSHPPVSVDTRALLNAEQVIKTKCTLCHDIQRRGERLAVVAPVIPTHWLDHASFSHTPHRNLGCETCHANARSSRATADILLPAKDACVACHGAASAKISSSCITCHEYHERSKTLLTKMAVGFGRRTARRSTPPATGDVSGMFQTILLYAIVILMLVVAVPFAFAFYQRLRRSQLVEKAQPARAAAPQPRPLSATEPPRPMTPVAPAADAASANATVFDVVTPARGQTVAMEWYGMLVATAGALQGQQWVIEESGLYIGRDPTLSAIVVPDSRVSKRHVRIVPRDGKVHAIDEQSTNGTFIGQAGGQRITDVILKPGDVVIVADNVASFTYRL